MTDHESYGSYKPQPTLGRSGGLSVETHIADPNSQPRTVVDTPIVAMKQGITNSFKPVRPQRQIHPYFVVSNGNGDTAGDGIASTESPGGSAVGKHIASLAEGASANDFSPAEQMHLISMMDSEPGAIEGWTNLTDVWQ